MTIGGLRAKQACLLQLRSVMNGGIVIGRIAGIRIQLDFSLIFIFLLVLFNLGAGVLPGWHPAWSPVLIWGVALAAALLFFASILLHELSHALVARRQGIPVRSITLFLFGGVANIEQEPATARGEAGMAAIGPAVSILLGVVFTVLGGLASGRADVATDPEAAFASMGPLSTLLTWLGPVNIVLGIFNMIPAFPLDGGRVLRALLWALTGDLARATRAATRVGQVIAWLLIVTGVAMAFGVSVPFLGRGLISGLWLAFIGWFMNGAARMTHRQVKVRSLLEGVPLRALLKRPLAPAIDGSVSISDFAERVAASVDSVFPVRAGEELVGLVAVEDLRQLPHVAWRSTPVSALMSPISAFPRVDADADLYDAMRLLGERPRNVLVVFDVSRLVGLLRHEDIARWIELQAEVSPGGRTPTYPHVHSTRGA